MVSCMVFLACNVGILSVLGSHNEALMNAFCLLYNPNLTQS